MTHDDTAVILDKLMPGLSAFGRHLFALMLSRDLRNFARLRDVLGEGGYKVHRQTVQNYVTGTNEPPPRFVRNVGAALDLSEEERRDLYRIYVEGE